jgi:hypothetical protein
LAINNHVCFEKPTAYNNSAFRAIHDTVVVPTIPGLLIKREEG